MVFIQIEEAIFLRMIYFLSFRELSHREDGFRTRDYSDCFRCYHLGVAIILVEAGKDIYAAFQVFGMDEIWIGSLKMRFFQPEGVIIGWKTS